MMGLCITSDADGSVHATLDHWLHISLKPCAVLDEGHWRAQAQFEIVDRPASRETHEFELMAQHQPHPALRAPMDHDDAPYIPYRQLEAHRLDRADQAFALVFQHFIRRHAVKLGFASSRLMAPGRSVRTRALRQVCTAAQA